jgi:hypothetical protein
MKTKLIEFAINKGYKPYFIWDNETLHSQDAIYIEHSLIIKWISENFDLDNDKISDKFVIYELENYFSYTAIVFDIIEE